MSSPGCPLEPGQGIPSRRSNAWWIAHACFCFFCLKMGERDRYCFLKQNVLYSHYDTRSIKLGKRCPCLEVEPPFRWITQSTRGLLFIWKGLNFHYQNETKWNNILIQMDFVTLLYLIKTHLTGKCRGGRRQTFCINIGFLWSRFHNHFPFGGPSHVSPPIRKPAHWRQYQSW